MHNKKNDMETPLRKMYSPKEAQEITQSSRPFIYAAIARGEIPSTKVGRRIFIPGWWIEQMTSKPIADGPQSA